MNGRKEQPFSSEHPKPTWAIQSSTGCLPDYIPPALNQSGLLEVFSIIAIAGAFVGFLRYDVR